MKKVDRIFNHLKFKNLLEETYGPNPVTEFADQLGFARSTVSGWVNDKTKKGPNSTKWKKISDALKKKGKLIQVSDFYYEEEYNAKESPIPYEPIGKIMERLDKYMQLTKNQSEAIKLQIETNERNNSIIRQLEDKISKLEEELNKLKKK